jgi:hypothetical protein
MLKTLYLGLKERWEAMQFEVAEQKEGRSKDLVLLA